VTEIVIDADFNGMSNMLGVIQGMTETISTEYYKAPIMHLFHAKAVVRFDRTMATMAMSNPKRYHHVYEWDSVGINKAKLWRHEFKRSGASYTAGYHFITSKKPIPLPTPRNTGVAQKYLSKLSGRRYIFRYKAEIMEHGIPVVIKPRYSKHLFIPGPYNVRKFILTTKPKTVSNPGGTAVKGAFATQWITWWRGNTAKVFNEDVRPRLEKDIRSVPHYGKAKKGRLGNRSIDFAFTEGVSVSERLMRAQAATYEREAELLEAEEEL
jgi:hypothetical protein